MSDTLSLLREALADRYDIARRLVESNHGRLDFESRPGNTEFRVALPATETL